MVYAPSAVTTTLASGAEVTVTEQTCYPFEEQVRFTIALTSRKHTAAEFPLELRIPSWSDGYTLKVNGEKVTPAEVRRGTVRVARTWSDGDEVTIEFSAPIRVSYWYDEAAVIERGPLVYALRMEERWSRHDCDDEPDLGQYYYEVTSPTQWNVALRRDDLRGENTASRFTVEKSECGDAPWSLGGAPIAIKCKARVLPEWRLDRNSAASFNFKTELIPAGEVGPETEIALIPYGCTTLRITEFPVR